jgi:hypothetical protein
LVQPCGVGGAALEDLKVGNTSAQSPVVDLDDAEAAENFDHQVIDAAQGPLPLGHHLRGERAVPVTRHVDADRANLGQQRYLESLRACR